MFHFVYPVLVWRTFGLFSPCGYCESSCWKHRCTPVCLSSCFRLFQVGLLDRTVVLCLISWWTAILFSTVAVSFLHSHQQCDSRGFQFLSIPTNICYFVFCHHCCSFVFIVAILLGVISQCGFGLCYFCFECSLDLLPVGVVLGIV